MKNKTKICIAYVGESVSDGTMDVNELAPALLALSNLIAESNKILNQNNSIVGVRLSSHIERGSFEMTLEIVHSFAEQLKSWFIGSDYSLEEILNYIGLTATLSRLTLIQLYRWIKERKIKKVDQLNKNTVKIYVDNESKEISIGLSKLFFSYNIQKHLESVLYPLKKDGVEVFEIRDTSTQESIEKISDNELDIFTLKRNENTEEKVSKQIMRLKIKRISFERGSKWKFDDGDSTFVADVKDENFLNEVISGNFSFSQSDEIEAEIEFHQQFVNGLLKKSYKIVTKILKFVKVYAKD